MLVDSHCHLNYKGLVEQSDDVIVRARAAGVRAMLNISTRENEWNDVIGLAEQHPDIWASVGIHPHDADNHPDIDADKLIARAAHPRVIGIGETGLDYYYDKSDRDRQRHSFRAHINAARETRLPIIIHTRDAEEDTARMLQEEMQIGQYTGVIHCFTASADFARKALDIGLYISLSGIVTFKNAHDLQDVVKWLPSDRILVETDAPFLAPVPHRGKTGEPSFVADTARFVAYLRSEQEHVIAGQTTANFYRLFSKAAVGNV
jgi:TatD DNase family protein